MLSDAQSGMNCGVGTAALGRFIGRDPLGYVDGMGLYNGYFAPNGLDPFGLIKILIMVDKVPAPKVDPPIKDPNFADGDQTSSGDAKDIPEKIREHNADIDSFVTELKKSPKQYDYLQKKGLVTTGGKVFKGTIDEYIAVVLKDKAKIITQVNGGLGALTVKIDEETKSGNEVTVFGHTYATEFNNGKVDTESSVFKLPSGELGRPTVQKAVLEHNAGFISCYEGGSDLPSRAGFEKSDSWTIGKTGIDYAGGSKFIIVIPEGK